MECEQFLQFECDYTIIFNGFIIDGNLSDVGVCSTLA